MPQHKLALLAVLFVKAWVKAVAHERVCVELAEK
jgi:hypothetical protein